MHIYSKIILLTVVNLHMSFLSPTQVKIFFPFRVLLYCKIAGTHFADKSCTDDPNTPFFLELNRFPALAENANIKPLI